jgi:hypothetical protein
MEILEAMNAHLGTHFSTNSNWQVNYWKNLVESFVWLLQQINEVFLMCNRMYSRKKLLSLMVGMHY